MFDLWVCILKVITFVLNFSVANEVSVQIRRLLTNFVSTCTNFWPHPQIHRSSLQVFWKNHFSDYYDWAARGLCSKFQILQVENYFCYSFFSYVIHSKPHSYYVDWTRAIEHSWNLNCLNRLLLNACLIR